MMRSPVLRAWVIAALWMAVIALESFAGSSENTGRILRPILEFFLGPLHRNTFYLIHNYLRKGGHFFGYGVLSFTLYRAWWTTLRPRTQPERLSWRAMLREWSWRATVLALLVTVAVAGSDEWQQSFRSNRGGSVRDVMLDGFGGWLAQLALLIVSAPRLPAGAAPTKETATISS